jgi:hypothetical protein
MNLLDEIKELTEYVESRDDIEVFMNPQTSNISINCHSQGAVSWIIHNAKLKEILEKFNNTTNVPVKIFHIKKEEINVLP